MSEQIIYKKNSKGTLFFWRSFVKKDGEKVYVITEHGVNNGKVVKKQREIKKKGRENTLELKAIKSINKKISDKIKKEGYVKKIEELKNKIFVSPMLAKKVTIKDKKIKGMKFPLYVQPKIDGFRCMCYLNNNNIVLVSRNNIEYKGFQNLKENLKKIFNESDVNINNLYLDGELYSDKIPFEELSGYLKKSQNHSDYDCSDVEYRVFDCFEIKNKKSFEDRDKLLKKIFKKKNKKISYIETVLVNNIDEFENKFNQYLTEGYEGIMARNRKSFYFFS